MAKGNKGLDFLACCSAYPGLKYHVSVNMIGHDLKTKSLFSPLINIKFSQNNFFKPILFIFFF